jgi:phage shock protein PspC (stress-responsive transcriptional regulator)
MTALGNVLLWIILACGWMTGYVLIVHIIPWLAARARWNLARERDR